MKVVYHPSVLDQIRNAVRDAELNRKRIAYVELTSEEFTQYRSECFDMHCVYPSSVPIGRHYYSGVEIRREHDAVR